MTIEKLETIMVGPIKTDDATLTIQMPGEKLKVGGHTFQLMVTDDSGLESVPATVIVIVADTQAPTAVLVARDERGQILEGNEVPFGNGFMLDGRKSVDIAGKIVSYTWTMVE